MLVCASWGCIIEFVEVAVSSTSLADFMKYKTYSELRGSHRQFIKRDAPTSPEFARTVQRGDANCPPYLFAAENTVDDLNINAELPTIGCTVLLNI